MPWERRGDFESLIADLRERHRYQDGIKWTNVSNWSVPFYSALLHEFFRRAWLVFRCVVVRKAFVDMTFHKDIDEARQKHFAMLVKAKAKYFCGGARDKAYHFRVDALPSRYKKADEVTFRIAGAQLKNELGLEPLKTRNHKSTYFSSPDQLGNAQVLAGHTCAVCLTPTTARLGNDFAQATVIGAPAANPPDHLIVPFTLLPRLITC